jgi:signal transduction histidine kinase
MLYSWLRRHPKVLDGGLAAVLAFLGIASGVAMAFHPGAPTPGPPIHGSFAVEFSRVAAIPLAVMLAVPVIFRRSHPVGAFAAAVVIGGIQVLLNVRPNASDLAIVILLYTLAAYTPRRISVTGLAICLLGSAVAVARWMPGQLSVLDTIAVGSILFAGPSLIAWVFGDSMRYRRAYYTSLEDRAARLEAERDAQAQIAAAAERARIARELHDVVAHNVSVMVVQADGASYALGSDPDRVQQALAAIASTGRQALMEMRRMLGVLRRDEDGTEPERAPLPGIGQLGELLEQTRATGLAVSFTVEGVPQPLPDGAALAAYRIVQESLTNTRKHGGSRATAQVTLRYLEDALLLRITDDGRGGSAASDGAGHGLTGMRERVAIYGGWVQAGPRPSGGYQVTARLPLTTPAAASATLAPPAPAPPARRGMLADTKEAGAA